MPAHHFTVDVEEYFQVSALAPYVARSAWESFPSRVVASTTAILDLCDEYGVKGTFFTLSWVAERHPALVRDIKARGHELASHGTDHRQVTELTPDEFRQSVRESKDVLEQLAGSEVAGYRAPSFSIVHGREWALDALIEAGYRYDSSLFPVRRKGSGYPEIPTDPHVIERAGGRLMEYPPATLQKLGRTLPAGGGAYLRLISQHLVGAAVEQAEQKGMPATIYIHPWEVDPDQPRVATNLKTRIRHYGGLGRTLGRLRYLLGRYRFRPIIESLAGLRDEKNSRAPEYTAAFRTPIRDQ